MTVRKRLVELSSSSTPPEWLPVQDIAQIELTSEDDAHPIESALIAGRGTGWRAAGPGEQVIRLVFDRPQAIRLIHLIFEDAEQERVHEFTLRWSSNRGGNYAEIVRQQFSFSPSGATREVEDYALDVDNATDVELRIKPDLSRRDVVANLKELRIR